MGLRMRRDTLRRGDQGLRGVTLFVAVIIALGYHAPASAESVLKMGGVGSALESMKLVAEAFKKTHPGIRIQILPSLGSTGGIKAVLEGALDIGLSGRPLNDGERTRGAIEIEYARTPFVFVTNRNTTASGLSTGELVEIYEGKRQEWPEGTRIRLVLRPESDVDTAMIKQISPRMEEAVKAALSRQGMIVAMTNQDSDDLVEKTRGSLGASTLAQLISEKRSSKILSFNGIHPSVRTLADGSYPLVKRLYMITSPKASPLVREFISFILSSKGRRVLSENGHLVLEDKPKQ
jgi:phosphate transport system substrate-binding protein